MHVRTDEEIHVRPPRDMQTRKYWRLNDCTEQNPQGKLTNARIFSRNEMKFDRNPDLDLMGEEHGYDFLVVGKISDLENIKFEFNERSLVESANIRS